MNVDQRKARAGRDIIGRDQYNIEKLNVFSSSPDLANEKITENLDILRAARHFIEFDRFRYARTLAENCISGRLMEGSELFRCIALAWCARIISTDCLSEAEGIVAQAKLLGNCPEIEIAEAFIASKKCSKADALRLLALIDSAQARSASLFVVTQHDGKTEALEWFSATGMQAGDLDADGKHLLLDMQLELADWSGAETTANECTDDDCFQTPILRICLAFTELLKIVPREYRQLVHAQVPFEMNTFELAADQVALGTHKRAWQLFRLASDNFAQLGVGQAAKIANGYELWLALRHPDLRDDAIERLSSSLRKPSQSLRLVPFALCFSVELDIEAVEKEIGRQVALNGGTTNDTAVARLSLALKKSSRAEIAKYIAQHKGELEDHIDPRALAFIEIEMLAKSGQSDTARKVLEELSAAVELSSDERARLDLILSEMTEGDLITARQTNYEDSESLTDLRILVNALEEEEDWARLSHFAEKLHVETHSLSSAEQLVVALVKSGRDEDALTFLADNQQLLTNSLKLRSMNCWALYHSGRILRAKEALGSVSREYDTENYRALRYNIAITSGNWNELSLIVGDEAEHMNDRSAEQLLQAAYLGFQIGAPAAKTLLFEAANKGCSDANILAAAYFLAANSGLEENAEVLAWLHNAAELSGDDGPMYTASLEEILDKQPEQERRQQNAYDIVCNSDAPMFIAAQSLGRSLTEMTLTPMLANQQEPDPRRRVAIPAFSGKRSNSELSFPKVLGLDASSLLLLGGLGLLSPLKNCGCALKVPHSTLQWLFTEKQRSSFHQPSRFYRAQEVQNLLADGKLSKFSPSRKPQYELTTQVGDELSSMLSQAEDVSEEETANRAYVVRSFPVPRIGSFLRETADLSAHQEVLVSCLGLVDKLVDLGRISSVEAKRARSFLVLNEKQWPDEPKIQNGATLYLDSLSVSYLQSTGLLDKLSSAGFNVLISSDTIDEIKSLLAYQRMSGQVNEVIEDIREFLQSGITEGIISLGAIQDNEDEHESDLRNHPTFEAMLLAKNCEAIVIDDRFINQHSNISGTNGSLCPVLTSLDLLKLWQTNGIIDGDTYQEAMVKLRFGGALFLEINLEELIHEIERCDVLEGKIQESAELRSIREGFVFARMAGYLSAPKETPWLDRSINTLILAYRQVWSSASEIDRVTASVNWLLPLLDVRGWLYCFPYNQAQHILHEGRQKHLSILVAPPRGIDDARREQFLQWVDERILRPLKREDKILFNNLVNAQKSFLLEYLDDALLETGEENDQ